MAPHDDHHDYHPQDAVRAAISGTMVTGSAGLFISAIQNTLAKHNVSAWGAFTRTGGTVAVFAAMGGVYEFAKFASANMRERNSALNSGIGGFFAGSVLGLRVGTTPAVLGFGVMTAVVMGAFDFTGGTLQGYYRDPDADEFARKQELRKNRRKPIAETIQTLGEGRGIYAPGYDERRAARIKEAYGIDVPSN